MDAKTKAILEKENIKLDDFSVRMEIEESGYSSSNESPDEADTIYFTLYNRENSEDGDEIGGALFFLYNALEFRANDIRDMADGYSFFQYQATSSIRIYPDRDDANFDEGLDYEGQDSLNTPWITLKDKITSYQEGYGQGTFEGLPYHPNTKSVWGRIVILDGMKLDGEYRTTTIAENLFKIMLSALRKVGFDWVVVNPNIDFEPESKEGTTFPISTLKEYKTFLRKLGFSSTKGRLRNSDVCFGYDLQNRSELDE